LSIQYPLEEISRRWSGDAVDISSFFQVKSMKADSKLVLVHNHGYNLRFHLHQNKEYIDALIFPLICGDNFSSLI